ncbi:hypothetical protein F2Q68_00012444 [Brassica cretica]|uniref:DUF4283 domain-containing protein n=1 Tax=Brassica cretica TaxID=69181 RepID=A0A8S9KQM3_BRACR|nr:hypothetical protein F2Q68_00012444 [Brassica cretica]
MTPKKKRRNALRGSTKMARLQGAAKPSVSFKSLKKQSPLVATPEVDVATATDVVLTTDSPSSASPESTVQDASLAKAIDRSSTPTHKEREEVVTPAACEEEGVRLLASEVQAPPQTAIADPRTTTPVAPPTKVRNYASLLKASAQLEEICSPSEHISGAPFVFIPDENIKAAKEEFCEFIYARFHGEWPSMGRIIGVVNALWARAGPSIFAHNVGEAPWSPEFTHEEAPLTSAINPVELRDIPYLLFNKESLSRIATAVGKHVSLAPETERKENFKVAKLYVRVDLTKPLPKKVISGFSNGREAEISVSYPWLPLKCDGCRKYGHSQEKCRNRQGMAPPRKRSVSPNANGEKARKNHKAGRTHHHDKAPTQKPESSSQALGAEEGDLNNYLEGKIDDSNVESAKE